MHRRRANHSHILRRHYRTSATLPKDSGLPSMLISTGDDGLLTNATQQDVCQHIPVRIQRKLSSGNRWTIATQLRDSIGSTASPHTCL